MNAKTTYSALKNNAQHKNSNSHTFNKASNNYPTYANATSSNDPKSHITDEFISKVTKDIQELHNEIKSLKNRIKRQDEKITTLEKHNELIRNDILNVNEAIKSQTSQLYKIDDLFAQQQIILNFVKEQSTPQHQHCRFKSRSNSPKHHTKKYSKLDFQGLSSETDIDPSYSDLNTQFNEY